MGLDTYIMKLRPLEEEELTRLDGVRLCGGMFSGNGSDGSFRGKVYADALLDVFDIDLYDDVVTGNHIHDKMAMRKSSESDLIDELSYHLGDDYDAARDLYKVLKECADNGWCLVSWY